MEKQLNIMEEISRERLAEWHRAPVILASSSAYRRQALLDSGFADVATASVPEEVEREAERRLDNPFLDKYDFKATERIARAKVEYLLKNSQIPDEALVIAADTVPTIYFIREKYDPHEPAFEKLILHKPENEKEANDSIVQMLTATVQAWVRINDTVAKQLKDPYNRYTANEIFDAYKLGFLPLRVRVTTGVAIRLPNKQDIKSFNVPADIVVQAAIKLARKYQDELATLDPLYPDPKLFSAELKNELEKLAEEVLEETKKSGVDPTRVAGGINWADPKIFRLLNAQEITHAVLGGYEPEAGVYLGLPAQALEFYLKQQSVELDK